MDPKELKLDPRRLPLPRLLFAEMLGTFILTLFDAGVSLQAQIHPDLFTIGIRSLTPAFVVFSMIFAFGEISGAHINPAVTLAFAVRGVFPWKRVFQYWIFQLAGALLAACVLYAIFGVENGGHLGSNHPMATAGAVLTVEALFSVLLYTVILATSHQHKISGPEAAFAVAAAIGACGFFGTFISGASMNPARSLGPAIVSGQLNMVWVYVLGPLIGAFVANGLVYAIHGPPSDKDLEAAEGEKNRRR